MREIAKSIFWSGLILAGLFGALLLACAPARAETNPWSREIAMGAHAAPPPAPLHIDRRGRVVRFALARGGSLRGIVAPLAAKAREIVDVCGARVVSGVRHTRVAGARRLSLHASGRAVDLAGSPRCIYAHLRGWPGGYSTDYARVRHVHVSWGGGEHGLRFAHRTHRPRIVRSS